MKPIRMKRAVWVEAGPFSNLQMLMEHPLTGEKFAFNIVEGKAETNDPYTLRCLLDHPKRNDPFSAGGFILIGSDSELEALYAESVGEVAAEQNPLAAAQNRVQELETKVEELQRLLTPKQKAAARK